MPLDSAADELLPRAIGGDQRALQALLIREGSYLRARVVEDLRRHSLHQDTDVDEVLQAVWTRIAGAIRKFQPRGEDSFRAWLKTITANAVNSHVRQVMRRREIQLATAKSNSGSHWSAQLLDQLQHDSQTPSRVLAQQELETRLNEALAELPPQYRQAIELHVRDGLTVEDAAERMACTVGQFRGYLQRGLEKLRANPRLREFLSL